MTRKTNSNSSTSSADTTQISVRLAPELVQRLDALCEQRMIGRNLIVARAIARLVDELAAVDDPLAPGVDALDADAKLADAANVETTG